MRTRDGGGPAFPTENFDNSLRDRPVGFKGMSMRDWFAGQALPMFRPTEGWPATVDAEEVARRSYAYADAMLKERSKP